MATIQIQPGDTLSGLAQQRGTTTQELLKLNPNITNPNLIQAGATLNVPGTTQSSAGGSNLAGIAQGIQGLASDIATRSRDRGIALLPGFQDAFPNIQPGTEVTPSSRPDTNIPDPTANDVNAGHMASFQGEVDRHRKQLEEKLAKQREEIETKIKGLEAKEKEILKNLDPETEGSPLSPFREDLENAERERLHINENFEANQRLVGELESLLTEGNQLIDQMRGVTGLAGIRNPRINQAIEAVNARAGVLQAVINVRNGQIAQAENMIDRSIAAINADRQDQLTFYETILNLNQKKIAVLEKDQKDIIESQIDLIRGDLAQAEANAQNIKDMMTDPDTAALMADAGVTLNDTPEQVNTKIADAVNRREIQDTKNSLIAEGYKFMTVPTGAADEIEFEVGGETLTFKKPPVGDDFISVGGKLFNKTTGQFIDVPGSNMASENALRAASTVVRDATDALYLLGEPGITGSEQVQRLEQSRFLGTGTIQATQRVARSKIFGTPEYEVARFIQSVKDNIGIDALLNIKREGSGLGQVPQSQLETLQGLLGRLELSRDPAILRRDISDVLSIYQAILDKATPDDLILMGIRVQGVSQSSGGFEGGQGSQSIDDIINAESLDQLTDDEIDSEVNKVNSIELFNSFMNTQQ